MKYTFIEGLTKKEYDQFAVNFPSTSFMQMSGWSEVKKYWKSDFVGMSKDGKLICAAMILKRSFFFGIQLLYVPRGFIIDYKNLELLRSFTESLKKYAKKQKAFCLKIDPFICFNEENIQVIKKKKKIQTYKAYSQFTEEITTNLIKVGYVHRGYRKEVNAYIQPRYTMAIPLKDDKGNVYDKEALRKTFPRNTRNYIGKYHEERGIEFSVSKNVKDIDDLVKLLKMTESRQHVSLRNQEYFKQMMESFPDQIVLFFAKVNIAKYIDFLNKDMKEHEDKKDFCMKQISEAEKIRKEYGDIPIAAASIVMLPTCRTGTKTASFLYAGTDTDILPSLKITNGLMYYRLCYCLDMGCDYCDLGGVDGSLEDHLSTFKSKFNPNVLELVGEYDLVVHGVINFMFVKGIAVFKYIRSKLKR